MKKFLKIFLILLLISLIGGTIIKLSKKSKSINVNSSLDIVYELKKSIIITEINKEINLLDNVISENKLSIDIQGEYDISKENIYHLNYILSTDNKATKEPFTLIVASNIAKTTNNFDIYTI